MNNIVISSPKNSAQIIIEPLPYLSCPGVGGELNFSEGKRGCGQELVTIAWFFITMKKTLALQNERTSRVYS